MEIQLLFQSEAFFLVLNLAAYTAGVWLCNKLKTPLLHPLLLASLLVIAYLKTANIPYYHYFEQSRILRFMLDLSVVSLGYLLWEYYTYIRTQTCAILGACFVGSLTGILTVVLISWLLGADAATIASLQPKSVTTPIAIGISQRFGGLPALTAVIVILCGMFGSIIGPWILDKTGIRSRMAQGLAMGAAAHGIGTARALKMGAMEGAMGGLAIGVMGVFTAICAAALHPLFIWLKIF